MASIEPRNTVTPRHSERMGFTICRGESAEPATSASIGWNSM
jgi:hypothetical protein